MTRRCRVIACRMNNDYTCSRCDKPAPQKQTWVCKLFGCTPVVGEDIDACKYCGRALHDGCTAIFHDKPTLRCRIFGCTPAVATWLDEPPFECSCGKPAFVVGPDGYGLVHQDCCRRCGRPIIPTARVART